MRNVIPAFMIPAICLSLAADTTGRIAGKVTTLDGQPVANAVIVMVRKDITWIKEIRTNDKGAFMQVGLEAKDFSMTVSAPGYQPYKEELHIPLGETLTRNVTLMTPKEASADALKKGYAAMAPADAKAVSGTAAFNSCIELYNQKKFAEALPFIEKGVAEMTEAKSLMKEGEAKKNLETQLPSAERVYGIVLYEVGKEDPEKKDLLIRAEPYLKGALDKTPKDTHLLTALVAVANAKNDPAAAKTYQDTLDAVIGPRPELAYNDGVTAFNDGKIKEAKEHLDKAIRLDPKFPDSYYLLGMVEYALNDLKATRQAFKTYLDLAPNGKKAGEVKQFLKELK